MAVPVSFWTVSEVLTHYKRSEQFRTRSEHIPNEVRTHSERDQRVSNEVRTRSEQVPNTVRTLIPNCVTWPRRRGYRFRVAAELQRDICTTLKSQPFFSTASLQTREKGLETWLILAFAIAFLVPAAWYSTLYFNFLVTWPLGRHFSNGASDCCAY